MKSPPQLGGFIRREIIEPLGLSVTDAASALAFADVAFGGHGAQDREGVRSHLDSLMRMQLAFDLAEARRRESGIKVKRFSKPSAAA